LRSSPKWTPTICGLRAPNIGVKYDGDQHITDLVLLDWGKAFRLRDFSGKALEKRVKDAKESLGMGKKKIADAYEIDGLMLEQLFIE